MGESDWGGSPNLLQLFLAAAAPVLSWEDEISSSRLVFLIGYGSLLLPLSSRPYYQGRIYQLGSSFQARRFLQTANIASDGSYRQHRLLWFHRLHT